MKSALVLGLGLGLATVACDDDFLTAVPPDQISEATFWKTEQDALLATNAIYPFLYGWEATFLDAATDNAWAQKEFDGWSFVGKGVVDATSGTTGQFWTNSYRAIRRANEVLARIDDIPFTTAGLQQRLKGEARFLRAYHYLMLANLFGDVPLVLRPLKIDEGQVPRIPRAEVIDTVLAELAFAASVLPVGYAGTDRGRATQGAALALRARAALYESRWQLAAAAAQAVMDLDVYGLHPDYRALFTQAGEGNPEVILDEQYVDNLRPHSVFAAHGPGVQGGSDVVPLRAMVDDYYMTDGLPITVSPLYNPHPDSMYRDRDPRLYASLLYPGALFGSAVYESWPDSGGADEVRKDFNTTATGYQMLKYIEPADEADPGNIGTNLILIRYADVLLMYAEAKIELNQIDASVYDAINQVRRRAGMPEVPLAGQSQAELRDIVRHKRRVELAFEGLRLFDLRRWRIGEQVMPGASYGIDYIDANGDTQTIPGDSRFFNPARDYLWPIPLRELELNPMLTQNPGY